MIGLALHPLAAPTLRTLHTHRRQSHPRTKSDMSSAPRQEQEEEVRVAVVHVTPRRRALCSAAGARTARIFASRLRENRRPRVCVRACLRAQCVCACACVRACVGVHVLAPLSASALSPSQAGGSLRARRSRVAACCRGRRSSRPPSCWRRYAHDMGITAL